MILELAKHQDFTGIRLTQFLIQVMSKILATHMLQGNFVTEKVTSLKLEANLVEPSAFLPQRNKVLVKQELLSEVKATSENVMDFADSHKTKGKTAIASIGTMQSMVDFSSLCINVDLIITAIYSNSGPQPIFCLILLNFVAIVNNPDWVHWSDNVGFMPLLHWYCYSFLEQIFNCFAVFATDFGNGNIMTEACPITELNTSALKSALTVLKTFRSQINLHQATMTAITVMPGSVSAYNVNPWNNIQASGLKRKIRIPSRIVHLVLLPMPLSSPNSIMEARAIPQHPIQTRKTLPAIRGKRSPVVDLRLTLLPKRRWIWVCFTSVTRPSTQRTSSQRICPKSFVQTSPARKRSVSTPIAILLTPGRLRSSNTRLSS
jgi:hypothetical protein